jgi:hypothetical protein
MRMNQDQSIAGALGEKKVVAIEWPADTAFAATIRNPSAAAATKSERKCYAKLVCGIFNHRRVGGFAWLWRERWQRSAVGQSV